VGKQILDPLQLTLYTLAPDNKTTQRMYISKYLYAYIQDFGVTWYFNGYGVGLAIEKSMG